MDKSGQLKRFFLYAFRAHINGSRTYDDRAKNGESDNGLNERREHFCLGLGIAFRLREVREC